MTGKELMEAKKRMDEWNKNFTHSEELRKTNPGTKMYEDAVNSMILAEHWMMMLPVIWNN